MNKSLQCVRKRLGGDNFKKQSFHKTHIKPKRAFHWRVGFTNLYQEIPYRATKRIGFSRISAHFVPFINNTLLLHHRYDKLVKRDLKYNKAVTKPWTYN